MADSVGVLTKAACNVYTGWGTAWNSTSLLDIALKSENITKAIQQIQVPILRGRVGQTQHEQGTIAIADAFEVYVDYNNAGNLFQAAMGSVAAGPPAKYSFENDLLDTLRLLIERNVCRVKCGSLKITEFEISAGGMNEAVVARFGVTGEDIELDASNVWSTFSSTALTSLNPVTMAQAKLYIGAHGADPNTTALAASDAVSIASFALRVSRNMKTDIYGTADASHTANLVYEPRVNGFRETTLRISIPKYASNAFLTWKSAGTTLQAILQFTDGAETITFLLPQLAITDGFDPTTSGPEVRTLDGTLTAYTNDKNNAGTQLGNAELNMGYETVAEEMQIQVA